ncbi:DUF1460 domain-containing protein [Mycoplasma sp. NEAQ87857]|uniref:N-acetylmuramoyl-L-alanine amidase-like domain-containing protein n=1 Tax=Mycoplasma sp. NEAQ87857 TaxID=2683967 RepID=UPI001319756B|nr:N-acetylmuramoyl-L-alanine amidase-like domain-containing protein [Mycoplasma sp. NEAQ87857]QGZ97525.1 DUF1460 domain-containing protein [Mycoplasma sp. NEAQ87857]
MKLNKFVSLLSLGSAIAPIALAVSCSVPESAKQNNDLAKKVVDLEATNKKLTNDLSTSNQYIKNVTLDSSTNTTVLTNDKSMQKVAELIALKKQLKQNNPNITKNELISKISEALLGTKYVANRLIGDANNPEVLVADIVDLDCFTYFDYVNAILNARDWNTFIEALKNTRYVNGQVSYSNRRHFFTDWAYSPVKIAQDLLTKDLLGDDYNNIVVEHTFNKNGKDVKGKLEPVLKTVPIEKRTIKYLKASALSDQLLAKYFKDGDLIMLAAGASGGLNTWLDVTHCGYLIFKDGVAYYRNAKGTAKNPDAVRDIKLVDYIKDRNFDSKNNKPYDVAKVPGILVYRTL